MDGGFFDPSLAGAVMRFVGAEAERDPESVRSFPLIRPFPSNNMFANGKSRRHKTAEYCAWRTEQMMVVMASKMSRKPIVQTLDVVLFLGPTGADTDNCAKAYLDALQTMGVLTNDKLVRHIAVLRGKVAGQGYLMLKAA